MRTMGIVLLVLFRLAHLTLGHIILECCGKGYSSLVVSLECIMLILKASPIHLRVSVLLFPRVISLDYQGPHEILGFLDANTPAATSLPIESR